MNNFGLKQKVIAGSKWMVALRIARRSVSFLSALILTRILSPSDYGIVAIGLLVLSFFRVFTELGFRQSLIQKEDNIEEYINTAWTFEILKGISTFILVFLSAPLFLRFFEKPDALLIVRVMGVIPLISSLTNIRVLYFQKNLSFNKQFIFEISGVIAGLLVAISMALYLRNAWALVYGQIATISILAIISYFYYPHLPVLTINKGYFKEMFNFGKWILMGAIVSYIALEGDKYFVQKIFGISVLGLYKMAYMICHIGVDEIKQAVGKVLFPAYSKIQSSKEKLKNAVLNSYGVMFSVISPVAIGIFLIADDFGNFVLGDKWSQIGGILQLLALSAFTRGLLVSGSGIFWGIGKPKRNVAIEIARVLMLITSLLYFPFHFGINGVAYSLIISNLFGFLLMLKYLKSDINIKFGETIKNNMVAIVSLISMLITVSIFKQIYPTSLMRLIVSVILGAATYIFVLYLASKIFHKELVLSPKLFLTAKTSQALKDI